MVALLVEGGKSLFETYPGRQYVGQASGSQSVWSQAASPCMVVHHEVGGTFISCSSISTVYIYRQARMVGNKLRQLALAVRSIYAESNCQFLHVSGS